MRPLLDGGTFGGTGVAMIKLYNKSDTGIRYHEAWVADGSVVEHWGILGTEGETREHPLPPKSDETAALEEVLADARGRGFCELDDDEFHVLLIEYAVDGMGNSNDLAKRHALQARMDETLGWTGLGHCDGGSIGSGTMEVCCLVVDFDTARSVIESDLANSPFANFTRIFDEDAD
jgi:hypothetical protein